MKKLLPILILLFSLKAVAQDFEAGKVSDEEMAMKKYAKDTAAHAVVLNEYGTSRIDLAADDNVKLFFTYHVKIKIFDNKGFDQGKVEIPLYNENEHYEEVDDIKATTYYQDENGLVRKAELDKSKIFRVKDSKHWTIMKFEMPSLRGGCVVEYSYRLTSPYFFNFHDWKFQADVPKVYSEYDVHIPAFWTYNASLRGNLKLTKNKGEVERECTSIAGRKADCSHMTYGMADIPALIEEDYMTSKKNFLSVINFELVEYVDINNGAKIKETKEWKDVDYQMKDDGTFGGQIRRTSLMKEKVAPVIANITDELDKAKAIYHYMQKWYKWNEISGIVSPDGISKAYDAHSGSVADINLALVAALNSVGLNAEAVALSTREHGFVNKLYPVVNDFNYVIAKVNVGDKSYLLDATDPLLPFGVLPMKCINDQGRVFPLSKPSYWIDLTGLPQKENTTYNYELTLQDNGKFKGTMIRYSSGYSAYLTRKAIKKYNSTDEYVESIAEKFPKLRILKSNISGVDSLDNIVAETFEIELSAFDGLDHTRLSFNPMIFNRITTNPFKLNERDYPVDWGMASDDRYVLVMHVPAQYGLESSPAPVGYGLPNDGGKFLVSFDNNGENFTYSSVLHFSKGIYGAEEYPYLKEFYNKVILAQKSDIVLKKK